jgi:DNA-binding NarL/FixJ family response regulator
MMQETIRSDQLRLIHVDDHPFAREALRWRLEMVPRFQVVGEAGDCFEALALIEATTPDLAVIDIGLGTTADKPNGLFLAREVHKRHPEIRVVIWSMYEDADYVASAKAASVCGYVSKSRPTEELVKAIEEVAAGRCCYPDSLEQVSVQKPRLTPTEKKVLTGVANGKSSKEIAEELGNDYLTVNTHRGNIMKKLGAKKAAAMTTIALRLGLIDPMAPMSSPCARSSSSRRRRSSETNPDRVARASDPAGEAREECDEEHTESGDENGLRPDRGS